VFSANLNAYVIVGCVGDTTIRYDTIRYDTIR